MPNAELAYKILDEIDADPESWRQDKWICGTAACFGGKAILAVGGTLEYDDAVGGYVATGGPFRHGTWAQHAASEALDIAEGGGWVNDPPDSPLTGAWLFDADNDRHRLGEIVEALFGPRPEGQA